MFPVRETYHSVELPLIRAIRLIARVLTSIAAASALFCGVWRPRALQGRHLKKKKKRSQILLLHILMPYKCAFINFETPWRAWCEKRPALNSTKSQGSVGDHRRDKQQNAVLRGLGRIPLAAHQHAPFQNPFPILQAPAAEHASLELFGGLSYNLSRYRREIKWMKLGCESKQSQEQEPLKWMPTAVSDVTYVRLFVLPCGSEALLLCWNLPCAIIYTRYSRSINVRGKKTVRKKRCFLVH